MSTTGKLGTFAICLAFSTYLLGVRLAATGGLRSWNTWYAAFCTVVSLVVFLRTLFNLHATLVRLSQEKTLRQKDGHILIP